MVKLDTYSNKKMKEVLHIVEGVDRIMNDVFDECIECYAELPIMLFDRKVLLLNGERVNALALIRYVSSDNGAYAPYLRYKTKDLRIEELPLDEVTLNGKYLILQAISSL